MWKPRQNGHNVTDEISKCIFLNENIWFLINISLKFVPKGQINNIPALVRVMACGRTGHYLNQWCLVYRHIYASLGLNGSDCTIGYKIQSLLLYHFSPITFKHFKMWALSHLFRYRDFYHKDKMVVRPSYLYNGNPYSDKMELYSPQVAISVQRRHLTSIGNHIIKITWSYDCLIFIMDILIPEKTVFILRWAPGASILFMVVPNIWVSYNVKEWW